jgi:predicted PurR-regulated permease PerM
VPVIGALLSGLIAVMLALVAKGPITALIMLGVVIGVQQIESHVLQPFLLGRAVRVHPLAVILSIAAGVILWGIVGALIAVPVAAVVNAVSNHLLADSTPAPDDADDLLTPAEEASVDRDVKAAEDQAAESS